MSLIAVYLFRELLCDHPHSFRESNVHWHDSSGSEIEIERREDNPIFRSVGMPAMALAGGFGYYCVRDMYRAAQPPQIGIEETETSRPNNQNRRPRNPINTEEATARNRPNSEILGQRPPIQIVIENNGPDAENEKPFSS